MQIFKVLLFASILIGSNTFFAQAPTPSKHFTVNDGIAQQQVTALFQDCRAFIWIGTKGGLSRFDGKDFKNYGLKEGFPDLHVKTILPYKDSLLIIQSPNKTYAFDGVTFRLLHTLPYGKITVVKPPYIFIEQNKTVVVQHNFETKETKLLKSEQANIKQIVMLHDSLFFFNDQGDYGYLDDELRPVTMGHKENSSFFLMQSHLYFQEDDDTYSDFYKKEPILHFEKEKSIKILTNHPPTLFYDPIKKQIIQFNTQTKRYNYISPIASPRPLIIDKNQYLWIGTEEGLFQFFPNFSFYNPSEFRDIWSVVKDPINQVYRLLFFVKGEFWINKNMELVANKAPLNSSNHFYVGSISKDSALFITTGQGISILQSQGEIKNITTPLSPGFECIALKNNHVITGGAGLIIDVFPDYSYQVINIPDSLLPSGNNIRALTQLSNGHVLLGSNTIIEWNPRTNTFSKVKLPKNTPVISLETDHLNQIWVGTKFGLYFSKDTSLQFRPFLQEFLDEDVIVDITFVSDSLLIVGTNKRLIGIDPRTATSPKPRFKSFNHNNGYMTIEAAQNGIKVFGDQIWIPGIAGLSIIEKDKFHLDVNEFDNLWIEAINEHPITFRENNHPAFSLKHNEKNIVINYTAIGANRPDEKLYSYRLLGQQEEWSPWTKDQTAFFNQLSSGTYTFCLRKKNTTNHDDDDEVQVKIKVNLSIVKEPYFPYLAMIFIVLTVLLAGLAFYYAINRKRVQQTQQKIAQAQQEANVALQMKNEIIRTQLRNEALLNTELTQKNKTIQLFSKNIRHYSRRALITARTGILRDAKNKDKKIIDFAQDAATRIESFLAVLDMLKTSDTPWLNVSKQIKRLIELLTKASNSESFTTTFHQSVNQDFSMHTSRIQSLVTIITELTVNSYNHANPKNNHLVISISISKVAENQYLLHYQDNGPGIPSPKPNSDSEGLSIIQAYANNLQGEVVFDGAVSVLFLAKVDE